MPYLTIRHNGKETTILCEEGASLSKALESAHQEIDQPCAGRGRCGKCRVVAGGALSTPTEEELRFLSPEDLKKGVRLACMTKVAGDAWVAVGEPKAMGAIAVEGRMADFTFEPLPGEWGVSVDIGTTTVAAFLYHLPLGMRCSHAAAKNPQAAWGADVISRIEQSMDGHAGSLQEAIVTCLNSLLYELAQNGGIQTNQITSFVITGNTTMLYLLTGKNTGCLSRAPFIADELFGSFYDARSLGLTASSDAQVYLPRCISAFVGADITTAILASGMASRKFPCLLVDIGTNGELALWTGEKLYCCSTAAGPALEGVNISCGMAALPGAIDTVSVINGSAVYTVIGGGKAQGICGSGIIDAAAALLKLGLLEDTGFLEEDFTLAPDILLTQQDIRNLQLAKGAICAGILTLLQTAGLSEGSIAALYLAGGFGSYINLKSAAAIGLIPAGLAEKTVVLGNAAGAGAAMLLQSRPLLEESVTMAQHAVTVELSSNPVFHDYYMECMLFPIEA